MVTELFFPSWSHSCYTLTVFLESYSDESPPCFSPNSFALSSCQSVPLLRESHSFPGQARYCAGSGVRGAWAGAAVPPSVGAMPGLVAGLELGSAPRRSWPRFFIDKIGVGQPAEAWRCSRGTENGDVFLQIEGALWRGEAVSDRGSASRSREGEEGWGLGAGGWAWPSKAISGPRGTRWWDPSAHCPHGPLTLGDARTLQKS